MRYTIDVSKRLQVVVTDAELRRFDDSAREHGLSLSEWVRQALRSAERETALGSADAKLASVRAAARHAFPAPDIDEMNAEIEHGYTAGAPA